MAGGNYPPHSTMRLSVVWVDENDEFYDPPLGVTCQVTDSEGGDHTYAAPDVVKDSVGHYHVNIPPPPAGATVAQGWTGMGAVQGYIDDVFGIRSVATAT